MGSSDARRVVGDYVTLVRGTTYKGALVGKSGPALLGLGSIVPGGGFRTTDFQTYGGDCPPELTLIPGDLYVSLKGATKDGKMIGSIARVPSFVASGRITQDTVKLVFRDGAAPADISYIHWMLRTPQYRAYCAGHAMGSAVVALSRSDFLKYPIPPASSATRVVVSLLDSIDSKIELNRRMAVTLEEMAHALFKSWFVDFNPVRAKAEGRDPDLPAATTALFPERLSEDGLPVGWRAGTLADVALLNPESRGSSSEGEIVYVDLANTKWGVIEETQYFKPDDAPSRAQRVLRSGDTIVGTVRPGNGSYALVATDGLIGSTGFAVLRPKTLCLREFVYLAATSDKNISALAALADGGAYPAVRPDVVADTPCCLPPAKVLEAFHTVTSVIVDRIAAARSQSAELAAIRDTLLSKLISGELRNRDAGATGVAA